MGGNLKKSILSLGDSRFLRGNFPDFAPKSLKNGCSPHERPVFAQF
jgi:hypothetical protein